MTAPSSSRPLVVGVLNCTPDSFHDGGRYPGVAALVARAEQMLEEGADWVDVGGESTRPGALAVPVEEELRRTVPVIDALRSSLPDGARISIDTRKPAVAAGALRAGASIVNDVTGLRDPEMAPVTADAWGTVVMHMRGEPDTMRQHTGYEDLVSEVRDGLVQAAARARSERVWIDPGIGFAKTARQSARLLHHTGALVETGWPVLIGASRKSFIGQLVGVARTEDRLPGSLAAAAAAWRRGASAFRVHDVAATRQALDLLVAIEGAR